MRTAKIVPIHAAGHPHAHRHSARKPGSAVLAGAGLRIGVAIGLSVLIWAVVIVAMH